MKPLAIFLVLLVIAALVGVGWLYFNSSLTVTFSACAATEAASQEDVFTQLKNSVESGTFVGTLYASGVPGGSEDYLFYTWTVRLENRSFLPADVIEIQITPMNGDVLLIGDPSEHTLAAQRSADLSATVLTSKDAHSVREAIVTWYVWGLPFSTRLTLGK